MHVGMRECDESARRAHLLCVFTAVGRDEETPVSGSLGATPPICPYAHKVTELTQVTRMHWIEAKASDDAIQ